MTWTCHACGTTTNATVAPPIRCACGAIDYGDAPLALARRAHAPRRSLPLVDTFLAEQCHACERYPCLGAANCQHRDALYLGAACPRGLRIQAKSIYEGRTIDRLNLLYHVCPARANDEWRLNLAEIRQRWRVFNGRRLLAVVQGDGLHDLETVRRELGRSDCEWLTRDNDPELREVATFLPLLEAIQSDSAREASFYAHTKGTSSELGISGPRAWRDMMYRTLLDNVEVVRAALLTHVAVGTTKMVWPLGATPPYPNRLRHGHWMFAGTYFWFKHAAVFGHPDWRRVPRDRYGAEAWLSGLFHCDEALTLHQPWPVEQYPTPSPYDPTLYPHRRV